VALGRSLHPIGLTVLILSSKMVTTICTICFAVTKLRILHTECVRILRMILRLNNDYFSKHIKLLLFVTDK
jgi:hypothetical protein